MGLKESEDKRLWRPILIIGFVVAIFIIVSYFDLGSGLSYLRSWISSFGVLGPMVFLLIYIGAIILAIPGTIFGIIAGTLFGSFIGVALISIGSTIGSSITFLIARYFARDAVERWVSKHEKIHHLDRLTEEYGIFVVAITRLIPLFPFNLLNYGLGLTRISFKTYVFWSWLCMLPGTIVSVVGADVFTKFVTKGEISWELIAIISGSVAILILIIIHIHRMFKQRDEIDKK